MPNLTFHDMGHTGASLTIAAGGKKTAHERRFSLGADEGTRTLDLLHGKQTL
jgi:hypothetical protein